MSKIHEKVKPYLGKHIGDCCSFSLGEKDSYNQCAHFVSHVLDYEFAGVTCKNLTWADKQKGGKGATIRVNDIFRKSPEVGTLSSRPDSFKEGLIFVTLSTNIKTVGKKVEMGNHPRKHVGILTGNKVWNYSNGKNKVVADTLEGFKKKFSAAYKTSRATVVFYYGKFA